MKRTCIAVVAMALVAGCGGSSGGGGGGGGDVTTPQTQVAASAAVNATIEAGGQALLNALAPAAVAQVVKVTETETVNYTAECQEGNPNSGTYTATGTVTADCTLDGANFSCTLSSSPISVAFEDCQKTGDIDGTPYEEVLNGTAGTNAAGTLSGNTTDGPTSVNASGTLSGTVTLTGDANGTVDLDNVTWTATGTPDPDPTIGCGGSSEVTIEGEGTQTCAVASDCSGCTT